MIERTVSSSDLALERLYHWERSYPERVVLTQPTGGRTIDLSWREVADQARRVAAHLRALRLAPCSRIAILGKNSAHWLIADFAIWMAGHVSVPIFPTASAATLRTVLQHSGSRLLFIGKLDAWESMSIGVPTGLPRIELPLATRTGAVVWDEIVRANPPISGNPVRAADDLATIIYTSGTTDVPKGVMHSFGTLAWSVGSALRRAQIAQGTRILSYLPLAHVAERVLVEHGLLARGMHVFFAESVATFNADLKRARPAIFFSVPRVWLRFQQSIHAQIPASRLAKLMKIPFVGYLLARKIRVELGLDACRYAASGAAPLPTELLLWYRRIGIPIVEAYGMTENCAVSHAVIPGEWHPGTVGMPYDGVAWRIDAVTGEVQMRSPGLMLGYYCEPELTRRAYTEDGWLRTGDQAEIDITGNLKVIGRLKDLFKTSKGTYVAPGPIESRLMMHGALDACVVTGAELASPLAIVVLNADAAELAKRRPGRAAVEAHLTAHLKTINAELDAHQKLSCLVIAARSWSIDDGFLTPTLKVKRARVEEAYLPKLKRWAAEHRLIVWEDESEA